jgi:hypothetical protein
MTTITGTVTLGASEVPGAAEVLLLNQACDTVVASTTSNGSTGAYAFTALSEGIYYALVKGGGVYRSRVYGPCTVAGAGDLYWGNVVSLLHFDGADASTTITDAKGTTWTAGGATQLDTAQSKFGGSSLLVSASGGWGQASSSNYALGTGDFTIEFWMRPNSASGLQIMFDMRPDGTEGLYPTVYCSGTDLYFFSNSTNRITATGAMPTGAFKHVAVARRDGVTRMFVEGVQVGASYADSANYLGGRIRLGASGSNGTGQYDGWLDEVRVTKGVARYAENFTPPTTAFSNSYGVVDPLAVNFASLMHFDGADASTTITDASGKVWTAAGNAQLDTAQSKFGGSSLLFDGSGDIIHSPNSADFNLGTGDFTVEGWVRLVSNVDQTFFSKFEAGAGGNGGLYFGTNSSGGMKVSRGGVADLLSGGTAVSTGTWVHVAACRVAGTLRTFVNGVVTGTVVSSADITDSGTNRAQIGGYYNGATVTAPMNGWIDEFRIVKGKGLYDANFTPPTQPYPNGRLVSLLHFDGANGSTVFTDQVGKTWTPIGGANISTAQSKFGGASGNFSTPGTGPIGTPAHADFNFGTKDFTVEWFQDWFGTNEFQTAFDYGYTSAGGILLQSDGSTGKYILYVNGSAVCTEATAPTVGTWYHYAVVRVGDTFTIYRNGVATATGTSSASISNTANFNVGGDVSGGGHYAKSWLDEFRVTKGFARYTAPFTPPTVAHPNP